MQGMLDFCAEQEVHPEIEVMAPGYINEAYERMLVSDLRYRFRDRYVVAAGLVGGVADSGQWPARSGQLQRHAFDVVRAGVMMGDIGDERGDLVVVDGTVGGGGRSRRR